MKRIWLSLLVGSSLFIFNGCSTASDKGGADSNSATHAGGSGGGSSASHQHLYPQRGQKTKIDPGVLDRVKATYVSVFNNDDKKAKFNYGRSYKYMPEVIQFALDIRFKNYEHALTVLPSIGKSQPENDFWKKVISSKPSNFSASVCRVFLENNQFAQNALTPTQVELDWSYEIEGLAQGLLGGDGGPVSEFDRDLNPLNCAFDSTGSDGDLSGTCEALSADQQKIFFSDPYFDKLHNMQRRDVRFVQANFRNYVKVRTYHRYVIPGNILKLAKAMDATSYSRKEHYLRRVKGVARDMRMENLKTRVMGDEILGDTKDKNIAARLKNLVDANPILAESTGLGFELAGCGLLPGPKQPTQ